MTINKELFTKDTMCNVYHIRSGADRWEVHTNSQHVSNAMQCVVNDLERHDLNLLHRKLIAIGNKHLSDRSYRKDVDSLEYVFSDNSYTLGLHEIRSSLQLRQLVRNLLCAVARRYVNILDSVNSITAFEIQLALDSIGVKVKDVRITISPSRIKGNEILTLTMPDKARYYVPSNKLGKLWDRSYFETCTLRVIKDDYNL